MKLVFASSPSHDILKRHIFLGTLCEPWELIEVRFNVPGNGNFGSPSWTNVIAERVACFHEIVQQYQGEIVVFADVDIQWFRPAQAVLRHELEGRDVVFQRESPDGSTINCGFVGVSCNPRSAAYFAELVGPAQDGWLDQEFTNDLLACGKMPCNYGVLPPTFYSDNLNGPSQPSNEEILLYHSIGTMPFGGKTSVQIKLEKHLTMRARVLGSSAVFRAVDGLPATSEQTKPVRYRRNAPLAGVAPLGHVQPSATPRLPAG